MPELHPVHDYKSGYFNTASGRLVSLHDPHPDAICIEDIAHALSHICRWGGHTPEHYSVAQHSIYVMVLARKNDEPVDVLLAALMHDAAEAYIHDIIKPLKHQLGLAYQEIEERFETVIFSKYGISPAHIRRVKKYDLYALEQEHKQFFTADGADHWNDWGPQQISMPEVSRRAFIMSFRQLIQNKGGNNA